MCLSLTCSAAALIGGAGKRFAEEEFVLLLSIVLSRFWVRLPALRQGEEARVPLVDIPTVAQVSGLLPAPSFLLAAAAAPSPRHHYHCHHNPIIAITTHILEYHNGGGFLNNAIPCLLF